jgi:UDP-N-acetylmuramoyl-tripeptide--D-alanyl-D-alanine ligase
MKLDGEGFCVLEMGASRPGDIRELCDIALPDYGIVTNIGPGHLEGFGSLEVVRDTKLEIASYVKILVFNGDDELLQGIISSHAGAKRKNYVSYGIRKDSPVMAKNIRTPGAEENRTGGIRFDLYLEGRKTVTIKLKVPGLFNVYNALAAAAMAHVLGIPEEVIKTGLEEFAGVPFRLEIKNMRGAVVISDMYNANPASMEEAVKELVRIKDKRAIAVLGDMLELGSYAETAHKKLGGWLAELPVDIFIGVGPLMEAAISEFRACAHGSRVVLPSPDAGEAGKILNGLLAEGDTVLIKGSRGMNMERILEEI